MNNYTIITSTGMNTHELVLWAVNYFGGQQIIIYPLAPGENEESAMIKTIDEFELDEKRIQFKFIQPQGKKTKGNWRTRDKMMITMSDFIYIISLRKNSAFHELIATYRSKIICDFRTKYVKGKAPRYNLDFASVEKRYPAKDWHYITHWTHSHSGPWCDERKYDYYLALVSSSSETPRSARATLEKIKRTGKILASSKMIRGDIPVVSFTELPPADALALMRWRSAIGRYNYEPFGIAVDKDAARSAGARPVIYGDEMTYIHLENKEKLFFQPRGENFRWHEEREWRYIGDFDLSSLSQNAYFFIQLA